MLRQVNRRSFLLGAGGAMLAVPQLTSLLPKAYAAETVAPRRFVAFSADRTRFDRMLSRMFGLEDGIHDRLTDFSRPVTGSFYFAPSLTLLAEAGQSKDPHQQAAVSVVHTATSRSRRRNASNGSSGRPRMVKWSPSMRSNRWQPRPSS